MTVLSCGFLTWTEAKNLEDDEFRLPEIHELYKLSEMGFLNKTDYYWSNTSSKNDSNWKKSLTFNNCKGNYPRELIGYKLKITAKTILIKRNEN